MNFIFCFFSADVTDRVCVCVYRKSLVLIFVNAVRFLLVRLYQNVDFIILFFFRKMWPILCMWSRWSSIYFFCKSCKVFLVEFSTPPFSTVWFWDYKIKKKTFFFNSLFIYFLFFILVNSEALISWRYGILSGSRTWRCREHEPTYLFFSLCEPKTYNNYRDTILPRILLKKKFPIPQENNFNDLQCILSQKFQTHFNKKSCKIAKICIFQNSKVDH